MTKHEWALHYAQAGWSIFPARGKEPHYELLKMTGFKVFDEDRREWKATTKPFNETRADDVLINKWWKLDPTADIKLVCGKISGVTVIDIDAKKPGDVPAEEIEAALGLVTMREVSGSGKGLHLYCAYNGEKTCTPLKQVEVKSNGASITIAPSVHPDTHALYRWDEMFPFSVNNLAQLPSLPPVLVEAMRKESVVPEGYWDAILLNGCEQGTVNIETTALIGKFLSSAKGVVYDWEKIAPLMWQFFLWWNDRQSPKLTEQKLLSTFKSILRREAAKTYGKSS